MSDPGTVGAFRVVPERDLLAGQERLIDSLDHLREQGLIETVLIGNHDQGVVLSDSGLSLLEANRRGRDSDEDGQEFHVGVSRVRALEHDASELRPRFHQLFFPQGIAFDGNGLVRTAATAPAFSYLQEIGTENERLVDQTRAIWNQLRLWLRQLTGLRETA